MVWNTQFFRPSGIASGKEISKEHLSSEVTLDLCLTYNKKCGKFGGWYCNDKIVTFVFNYIMSSISP